MRNFFLDILAILFGISAWISINGVFVELPLLVNKLPEQWALASYMSIIVQIANVGPLVYSLARWRFPSLSQSMVIYVLLALGTVASLLLALFWHETTMIAGKERSTSLFILVFFLAMVDCTSSVLFMPFMAVFKQIYLNSYLIGEGLSGFLPAGVALIQGVGGNPVCENVTKLGDNSIEYELKPVYPEPRFSVEVFFFFLMAMMLASSVAFLLMNVVPKFVSERETRPDTHPHGVPVLMSMGPAPEVEHYDIIQSEEGDSPQRNGCNESDSLIHSGETHKTDFAILLAILTFVCFLSNGALPSIQTYSCLPYGNVVYHLAVTLCAMVNPLMAFAAFFLPCRNVKLIGILTAIGAVFVGFILATALESPDMLAGQDVGGALTVIAWVMYGGLFSYVKISIAGWCRLRSDRALFWCGVWTQIGSAIGSVIAFSLVNYTKLFEQYYVSC